MELGSNMDEKIANNSLFLLDTNINTNGFWKVLCCIYYRTGAMIMIVKGHD